MYNPKATQGPIPNANNKVPIPTVPPRYQPIETTDISKKARTDAIGRLVFLWSPVINPSLGPGPKFAIKYIPLPNPVIKTANIASMIFDSKLSGVETYFKQTSIIAAIIIAFKIVPITGFSFKNIHKKITKTLIKKLILPKEKST